ncbi:hypothetical protein [Spirosoma fluviale]|uniref:hypothetical protein n=1 Tax=Spirosoma fluviale TaxID=1597977 RepID=UPI0015CE6D72|nr:hypothetical protein [Spirosoma fluviale]
MEKHTEHYRLSLQYLQNKLTQCLSVLNEMGTELTKTGGISIHIQSDSNPFCSLRLEAVSSLLHDSRLSNTTEETNMVNEIINGLKSNYESKLASVANLINDLPDTCPAREAATEPASRNHQLSGLSD